MKKLLIVLLAILMVLASFGCEEKTDGNNDETKKASDTQAGDNTTEDQKQDEPEETVLVMNDDAFNIMLESYQKQYPDIDIKSTYGEYLKGKVFIGKETVKYYASDRFYIEDGVTEIEHEGMKGYYSWDDDGTTLHIILEAGKMWVTQEEIYLGENSKDAAYERYDDFVNNLTRFGGKAEDAQIKEIEGGYVVTMEPSYPIEQMDDWQKCEIVLLCDLNSGTFAQKSISTMSYYENGQIERIETTTYDENMNRSSSYIRYDENGNILSQSDS